MAFAFSLAIMVTGRVSQTVILLDKRAEDMLWNLATVRMGGSHIMSPCGLPLVLLSEETVSHGKVC